MIKLSKLGFGLSSIAGSGNFAHQERLIRTAIDQGITHFDVAPYYGSGDAEAILGKILAHCPEQVTVTTKFGLVPFASGKGGSLMRSVLRPLFRRAQFLKKMASSVARQTHQPQTLHFTKGSLLKSVDESLKHIGRPLDILLLHDPSVEMASNADLLEELHQVKAAGKVTATGLSGEIATIVASQAAHPASYSVVQVENSLSHLAPVREFAAHNEQVITHRAIQGGLAHLSFLLAQHPDFKNVWLREVGIDLANREQIAHLLLRIALTENAAGSVLFSSIKPDRIKALAALLDKPLLEIETVERIKNMFYETAVID